VSEGERPVPTLDEFLAWPTERVAECVRQGKPKVCVFPINGTRRWFMLEYPEQAAANFLEEFFRIGWQRHIELYKLFFDHGITTLLTPVLGPDILQRGDEYMQLMEPGLVWLTQGQGLLDFYDAYDVRVRFYGDAGRYLRDTPYARVLDGFDALTQRTDAHRRFRLFFGVCAHDATETVAEIGVRFYEERGRLPDRREIVTAYYGEYVEPVDFFIGFEPPAAFDMPLIATGSEDLYFTVSPSPYLDAQTLRAILYDHLYCRRVSEDYSTLSPQDWQLLKDFYTLNRRRVLGLGRRDGSGRFWYPLPQVELPPAMADEGR